MACGSTSISSGSVPTGSPSSSTGTPVSASARERARIKDGQVRRDLGQADTFHHGAVGEAVFEGGFGRNADAAALVLAVGHCRRGDVESHRQGMVQADCHVEGAAGGQDGNGRGKVAGAARQGTAPTPHAKRGYGAEAETGGVDQAALNRSAAGPAEPRAKRVNAARIAR